MSAGGNGTPTPQQWNVPIGGLNATHTWNDEPITWTGEQIAALVGEGSPIENSAFADALRGLWISA